MFPAPASLQFAEEELFSSLAVPGLPTGGLGREGCLRPPAAVFEQLTKGCVGWQDCVYAPRRRKWS